MSDSEKSGMWAIVELFGHQRIAGLMTEQVIAGQGFVRIDVPAVDGENGVIAAHTKLFGAGAIYAINPVDETLATIAAKEIMHAPVSSYGIQDVLKNMPDDQRLRLLYQPPDDGLPF